MSKIRKLKVERILTELRGILQTATMEDSNFENISLQDKDLPQKKEEVTNFIKKQTKLWRNSWLIGPLEQVIKELEDEIER